MYGVIQRFGAVASNSIARMSRSKSRIDVSFEAGRIISPQPLCQFDRRELWNSFSTIFSKIVKANDDHFYPVSII